MARSPESRRFTSCTRKRIYRTHDDADQDVRIARHIDGIDIGEPYRCAYEDHWHIGHAYPGDPYVPRPDPQKRSEP